MGRGRGRKQVPGCEGGKSKQLYKCQAANCSVTPRGCDLQKHYESKTNWDLVSRMRTTLSEDKVARLSKEADPHTLFIFSKGYTRTRLPTWVTHVMMKPSKAGEGGSGQQSILNSFLKVSSCSSPHGMLNYYLIIWFSRS